jgi:hypothetical protein
LRPSPWSPSPTVAAVRAVSLFSSLAMRSSYVSPGPVHGLGAPFPVAL